MPDGLVVPFEPRAPGRQCRMGQRKVGLFRHQPLEGGHRFGNFPVIF